MTAATTPVPRVRRSIDRDGRPRPPSSRTDRGPGDLRRRPSSPPRRGAATLARSQSNPAFGFSRHISACCCTCIRRRASASGGSSPPPARCNVASAPGLSAKSRATQRAATGGTPPSAAPTAISERPANSNTAASRRSFGAPTALEPGSHAVNVTLEPARVTAGFVALVAHRVRALATNVAAGRRSVASVAR